MTRRRVPLLCRGYLNECGVVSDSVAEAMLFLAMIVGFLGEMMLCGLICALGRTSLCLV